MPVTPTTTAGLTLELGTVYGCTMTAGSVVVAASAAAFTPADVGRTVTVIGAGVVTGDPDTAAILMSTIASYVSVSEVHLVDVAITSVTPNFNLTVYRPLNTQADVLERSPISFNKSLSTGKATLDFSVWSADGSVQPQQGQPIWLHETTLGDLFCGFVNVIDPRNEPGTAGVETQCQCVDWAGVLTRRLIGSYNSSYSSLSLKALCEAIVYNHAGSEGFIVDSVTGPTIDAASYDYSNSAADGLSDACGKASSPSGSFHWYVKPDPTKTIVVVENNTFTAPFNLRDADGSQDNWLAQLRLEETGEKRANRAYVSGEELQPPMSDTRLGNGTSKTFSVTLPIGATPTITLNGSIPQTVGVQGIDTGKDWYWTSGSSSVQQDPGGTTLSSSDYITIDYQPTIAATAFFQYSTGVDEAAAVEGGTGFHDVFITVQGIQPTGTIAAIAENEATNLSGIPASIEADTYRGGLTTAQLITVQLTKFNIPDTTYLIDEISLRCSDNLMLWTAHMVSGPLIGDWRNAFLNLAGGSGGGSTSGASGGGGGSSLAQVQDIGTITAPTLISAPAVTVGTVLVVYGVQDATGYAVTWDALFQWPPYIDSTPLVGFSATFVGIGTKWVLSASIIGLEP